MIKQFLRILLHRTKMNLFEFLIDTVMNSVNEYRRAKREGAYDLHRDPYSDDLHKKNQDINQFKENH